MVGWRSHDGEMVYSHYSYIIDISKAVISTSQEVETTTLLIINNCQDESRLIALTTPVFPHHTHRRHWHQKSAPMRVGSGMAGSRGFGVRLDVSSLPLTFQLLLLSHAMECCCLTQAMITHLLRSFLSTGIRVISILIGGISEDSALTSFVCFWLSFDVLLDIRLLSCSVHGMQYYRGTPRWEA